MAKKIASHPWLISQQLTFYNDPVKALMCWVEIFVEHQLPSDHEMRLEMAPVLTILGHQTCSKIMTLTHSKKRVVDYWKLKKL